MRVGEDSVTDKTDAEWVEAESNTINTECVLDAKKYNQFGLLVLLKVKVPVATPPRPVSKGTDSVRFEPKKNPTFCTGFWNSITMLVVWSVRLPGSALPQTPGQQKEILTDTGTLGLVMLLMPGITGISGARKSSKSITVAVGPKAPRRTC